MVLCIFLAQGRAVSAEKPLIGIATVRNNSPRAMALSAILEENLVRMVNMTGIFSTVNPALLREEINKFNCTDEQCILGFARDAGLSLVIRGDIDDNNDFVNLTLRAYGIDLPYQRELVYQYMVRIPMVGKFGPAEYNNITAEHAGTFLSKLMGRYQSSHILAPEPDNTLKIDRAVTGSYKVYRPEPAKDKNSLRGFHLVGKARFESGRIVSSEAPVAAGDFILLDYRETSRFLDNFTYEGKKAVVFKQSGYVEALYALLITGPASAAMPILAPTLGYYRSGDWTGLTLWVFNATPYLYLEFNGISNYYVNYYKKKRTITSDVRAQLYFGWYMLCAGGSSLFVDSLAHTFLEKAANYQGTQSFMGNALTAGYLALISGGGGHFYRGHRLWGYLYYHADNLLLYFTLREFCPKKSYNKLTGTYFTGKINKTRAYSLLSAAGAVKIAEIIHAVLIRDTIRNGTIIDERYSIEPVMYADENNSDMNLGLQYSYRW